MSTRLGPRRRLGELGLRGGARAVHVALHALLAVAATLAAVGFALGSHRVAPRPDPHFGPWHSGAAEMLGIPVVVPLAMVVLTLLARRLDWSVVIAGLHSLVGLAILMIAVSVHFDHSVEDDALAIAGYLGVLGMMFGGVVAAATSLGLALRERKRLEATDPVFPSARIHR